MTFKSTTVKRGDFAHRGGFGPNILNNFHAKEEVCVQIHEFQVIVFDVSILTGADRIILFV